MPHFELVAFSANSTPNSSAPSPSTNSSSAPTGPDGVPMHDETSQQSTLSQNSDRSDGGRQTPKQASNASNSGPPPPQGQPGPGQYPQGPPGQYPPGSPHSSAPSPGGSVGSTGGHENSYGGPGGGHGGWGQQQGRPMTSPAPQVRPIVSLCYYICCDSSAARRCFSSVFPHVQCGIL